MADINWKAKVQEQWNTNPCGNVSGDESTLDYYLDVESYRYDIYAPWLKKFIESFDVENKHFLEIGFGQGTDHSLFARKGAICHGVDLTRRHYELASMNFRLRGLESQLLQHDASSLPFESGYFDLVYSFGVLHHTPDTNRCIAEAFRVLKPGGTFIMGMYHRHSFYYWFNLFLVKGILQGKLRNLGYRGLLSTIEKGADGIKIKPLVKLYTKRELSIMMADFPKVSFDIFDMKAYHLPGLGRLIPKTVLNKLGKYWGWYIFAIGTK